MGMAISETFSRQHRQIRLLPQRLRELKREIPEAAAKDENDRQKGSLLMNSRPWVRCLLHLIVKMPDRLPQRLQMKRLRRNNALA